MKIEFLNKILLAIIIFLLLVIAGGTIIAKISPKKSQDPHVLIASGKAENLAKPADTSDVTYFELGTLRISTLNEDEENMMGVGMVLSPWLAYPAGDSIFYEELMRKKGLLRGIFLQYFSEKTKEEILSISEEATIEKLKTLVNDELSLGKTSDIYFTDYLFLE